MTPFLGRMQRSKIEWVVFHAFGYAAASLLLLVVAATVMSSIAVQFGMIQFGVPYQTHHSSIPTIVGTNIGVAFLFFGSGYVRSRTMFAVLIALNLFVWPLAMSLIIPTMKNDWHSSGLIWMWLYIWLEIFAYMIAFLAGRCRSWVIVATPFLIIVAGTIEYMGIMRTGGVH